VCEGHDYGQPSCLKHLSRWKIMKIGKKTIERIAAIEKFRSSSVRYEA